MIESIMIFALGALSAALVGLLVLRMVWNRAVRLTTKRVHATLPLSIGEIKAERDQMRAEMALSARKAEMAGEEQRERGNRLAIDLAGARETIADLNGTLAARNETIANLEHEGTSLRGTIDGLTADYNSEKATLAETRETLAERVAEVAALNKSLAEQSAELDATRIDVVSLKTRVDSLDLALRDEASGHGHTRDRLTLVQSQLDDSTRALSEENLRGAVLRDDHHRLQDTHRDVTASLEKARGTISELQATLGEHRSELAAARKSLKALEAQNATHKRDLVAADEAMVIARRRLEEIERDLADKTRSLFAARTAFEELSLEHEGLVGRFAEAESTVKATRSSLADREATLKRESTLRQQVEAAHATLSTTHERERASGVSDKQRLEGMLHALTQDLETTRAEKNRLNGALTKARSDRDKLQEELSRAKAAPPTVARAVSDDSGALRERMMQLAAELAHITRTLEGPTSPINAIIAEATSRPRPRGSRKSLLDRINDLEKPISPG